MLVKIEHAISPYVAFMIMPLFAFANAGVSLEGLALSSLFFQTQKLYPIQFLGIFLFFLATIGSICFYKYQLPLSEYAISIFWLIASIILYQAGKPEFRNYFKNK